MGRNRSFSESELLDMTKQLLLKHGYDGFTLKLLSQHLVGARSTIYQYFANKEEIVAACMKRTIVNVLEKAAQIDESNSIEALRQLLHVYVEESEFHQLLGDANKINTANSLAAAQDLAFIEQAHGTLKVQVMRLFERALQDGYIRADVPLPALISVYFNLIDAPNMMNLPLATWSELLFEMWLHGAN